MHSNSHAETAQLLLSFFPRTSIPQNKPLKLALKELVHHRNPNHAKRAADLLRLCIGFRENRVQPGKVVINVEDVFYHFYHRLQLIRQETLMLMLLDQHKRYMSDVLISVGAVTLNKNRIEEIVAPALEPILLN